MPNHNPNITWKCPAMPTHAQPHQIVPLLLLLPGRSGRSGRSGLWGLRLSAQDPGASWISPQTQWLSIQSVSKLAQKSPRSPLYLQGSPLYLQGSLQTPLPVSPETRSVKEGEGRWRRKNVQTDHQFSPSDDMISRHLYCIIYIYIMYIYLHIHISLCVIILKYYRLLSILISQPQPHFLHGLNLHGSNARNHARNWFVNWSTRARQQTSLRTIFGTFANCL